MIFEIVESSRPCKAAVIAKADIKLDGRLDGVGDQVPLFRVVQIAIVVVYRPASDLVALFQLGSARAVSLPWRLRALSFTSCS